MKSKSIVSIIATAFAVSLAHYDAYADVITFGNLSEGTIVTSQFAALGTGAVPVFALLLLALARRRRK